MKINTRRIAGIFLIPTILWITASCATVEDGSDASLPEETIQPTRMPTTTTAPTPTAEPQLPEVICELDLPTSADWPVSLCDLFDDNRNEWQLESQDNPYARYTADIVDGQLQIDYSAKAFESFSRTAITWFDIGESADFALTISGMIDSRLTNTGWGIAFRANDDMTSYYLFSLNNDDTFSLEYNNNNKNWIPFIPRTGHSSLRNADMNTVTIVADGADFSFWINGTQVGTFEGVDLGNGLIRLMVSAAEGANVVFYFDDIVLQTPPQD